ncbi:hypothetical protein F4781DRAFT_431782 [Annulohypoxylon bovei var. microspora]|nr:hypothetical protein F4781DRAFT_431782 [Annulohypoxylon bovei var. microspora]
MAHLQTAECSACFETKQRTEFQQTPLTEKCRHIPTLCLECVTLYINSQIRDAITERPYCPECMEELGYTEIQRFATKELFSQYHRRAVDSLIYKTDNFVWCPLGCGSGLIHYAGNENPIAYCPKDRRQFCFRHRVPWHSDYTCDEYDAFLNDPQNFRSRAQIQIEDYRTQEFNRQKSRRAYEEAEARFAQSLLREEEAAAEARRRAHQLRIEQERREAEERARLAEEQRKAREEALRRARLRDEETRTSRTIQRLTKPCPGCKVPIKKEGGW